MYEQNGELGNARLVFDKSVLRDAVLYSVDNRVRFVLSASAQSGSLNLGKWVRSWIDEHGLGYNIHLVNALIDMYSKCGDLDTAFDLFEDLEKRDVISWNVMINACANLGALHLRKWIHAYIDKIFQNSNNLFLWTSLIYMYAKCGSIEAAQEVFNGMKQKILASWNAMISGLAMHGLAEKALDPFSRMTSEGFKPDNITFVGVLSVCSHAGLLDLGQTLIQNMEMKPDGAIWISSLGACRVHKRVDLGESVANHLFELEPENPGAYVLLSNI
ncbi:hypothetical protein CRYUN_Cryun03dG0067000 [Craigia yunnanensis]